MLYNVTAVTLEMKCQDITKLHVSFPIKTTVHATTFNKTDDTAALVVFSHLAGIGRKLHKWQKMLDTHCQLIRIELVQVKAISHTLIKS